jgi:hypothetical protein
VPEVWRRATAIPTKESEFVSSSYPFVFCTKVDMKRAVIK